MELHRLLADDDAVSPVIGVVLVVAITVVLAAVAGTLLFGVVDEPATVPTAQFDFELNDGGDGWAGAGDYVNVTHEGGDTLDVDALEVQVGGDEVTVGASDWAADVSAGDRLSLTDAAAPPAESVAVAGGIDEGEAVRVVWRSPDSSETFVVGETEVH